MNRPVHCVIYSHVWALLSLHQLTALGALNKAAIVELAINSNFSAITADPAKNRAGLRGLLRPGQGLQDIVETIDGIPHKVAFAPRPPVPVGALASAAALLGNTAGSFDKVVLMVNSLDAVQLRSCMSCADKLYIFWDMADPPTAVLAQIGQVLATQRIISKDNWGGFHLYSHPGRPVADTAAAKASFDNVLGQYPQLATPSGLPGLGS